MYVEIAEIDIDGWRSTIHKIGDVRSFTHERESEENDWTATITLMVGGGEGASPEEQTISGRGYGLEVVRVDEE